MQPNSETGAAAPTVTGILDVEGSGVPGHVRAAQGPVQRTATAATATAGVSAGKHDGTFYDAEPDCTAVYDAADDDARAHADAYDEAAASAVAAAATDDGATADDGTNDAIISNGSAAAIGLAAIGPAAALCWIRNEITNGEELLTVRGGQTGSFKQ